MLYRFDGNHLFQGFVLLDDFPNYRLKIKKKKVACSRCGAITERQFIRENPECQNCKNKRKNLYNREYKRKHAYKKKGYPVNYKKP